MESGFKSWPGFKVGAIEGKTGGRINGVLLPKASKTFVILGRHFLEPNVKKFDLAQLCACVDESKQMV